MRVELDAHGKKIPEVLQRFERLADTVWESLMDLAPGDLDALFEQLRGAGLGLKEVRVIRPGLAELLGHLTESQGTNGAMGLTGQ
ncbi:MAG: hypothetical protein HOI95_23060 [Chromatiales bacterium]|nr:hypothetical protein [Chromatiales bacterium]